MGSYLVVQCVRCLMGQLLYCSAADAGVWRERGYGDGSTPYGWLSSIALLSWLPGFLPQACPTMISSPISSICLSSVNSSPHPEIAPHSPNSNSQPLHLPGAPHSCLWYVWLARTIWLSFHLGCYRSAVSLSAVNVSPLTQTVALMWGSDPCFSSPIRRGQVQCY